MISQSVVIIYDIFNQKKHPVNLSVTIGNGQTGGTSLSLSGENLGSQIDSFNLELGPNSSLKGKKLQMVTTIKDIQEDTNRVTMDLVLEGGKQVHSQSIINSSVANNGDISVAAVSIMFI